VTHCRQVMLEELQRRNFASTTILSYLHAVEQFARYFKCRPDRLNQTHLRSYQAYLLRERKMRALTVRLHVAALRFFFVKTLKRRYLLDDTPYPKAPRRLPQILSVEEVARVIDAVDSLSHRTMLMVLYSTGMRNAELRHLQVADIDSRRMLIHIQRGKGGRDRYVPLSPTLLTTLRMYYRWMQPKTWLFPATVDSRETRRRPPRRASRGTTLVSGCLTGARPRDRLSRVDPVPLSSDVGGVREAAVWQSRARAALPRAVHPPRRHLQSPTRRRHRRHGLVSVEGLSPREPDAHADARRRRIPPAFPSARPPETLRPYPLFRPARASVPHRRSRDVSHGLGRRAATTRHRTVCHIHAHALVAVPALWRAHAHRRTADRASALPRGPPL
jgi:integrase/recombinase XerD